MKILIIIIKKKKKEKKKQIEKYQQYRKELEEQIRDNRRREIEKMRFQTMI